jgi:hypothetical protein
LNGDRTYPYPDFLGPKEKAAGYVKLGAIVCPDTTLTEYQILDGTFLRQSAVRYLENAKEEKKKQTEQKAKEDKKAKDKKAKEVTCAPDERQPSVHASHKALQVEMKRLGLMVGGSLSELQQRLGNYHFDHFSGAML